MTYVIYDHDSEFTSTECPCAAVALASDRAEFLGPELGQFVTVKSHGVWGKYADTDKVGKPCVFDFDWRRGRKELTS